MTDELLSVIVPVYNVKDYITECIRSISRQSYSNLEIIIIDDGSNDGTGELCNALAERDGRIMVIQQKNMGVMSARISGINAATGRWLTFVDGDDYIAEDMYLSMMNKTADADMVTCGICREEKQFKRVVGDDFPEGLYIGDKLSDLISNAIYDFKNEKVQRLLPCVCNKIFSAELMKEAALEIRHKDISYAEDFVMTHQYLLHCKSVYISTKPYYTYCYRETSAVHRGKDDILIDINKVYISLKNTFMNTDARLNLMRQLEKWVVCVAGYAFNYQMNFDKDLCPVEFLINPKVLKVDRIAIYGAGKCGSDYYKQLRLAGVSPVIWVDKNYENLSVRNSVAAPSKLSETEFDMVLIAVSREDMADDIKKELVDDGIDHRKIFWEKPVRVF